MTLPVWLQHRLPRRRLAPTRPPTMLVHRGADEAYADQLHATGELPVCDELATATEQWLHLHLDLNTIEDQLHIGLGAVLAAAMDALRVNEADLAASYGWAGVRELAGVGT